MVETGEKSVVVESQEKVEVVESQKIEGEEETLDGCQM